MWRSFAQLEALRSHNVDFSKGVKYGQRCFYLHDDFIPSRKIRGRIEHFQNSTYLFIKDDIQECYYISAHSDTAICYRTDHRYDILKHCIILPLVEEPTLRKLNFISLKISCWKPHALTSIWARLEHN
ncbi:conserved hypothetical protein [Trichinella spiralis]|uniref:hypothetical protein n=1 Tax=Trichinella spiralis TaxID=6334 RepID=UPI0001EFC3AF|nr:conserved hypothetical protein [Trichinella spiralis]